jgi:dTDP-4-amino-4,6-dideoxygalactose transaminase
MIPVNKPYIPKKTLYCLMRAVMSGNLSGNGKYTGLCQKWFEKRFGFHKAILTSSCTDALEMSAILSDLKPGDEVILPSFTFMSTANPFLLRGAGLAFADCEQDVPNIDPAQVENLITSRTKAIVVVHYSGMACDMDRIMEIAAAHHLLVIEDAAHSIDGFYKGKALGSIGHFGAFSFHSTKNIISGEGGLLVVNDNGFIKRAEIIWEKGTNRAAFHRGEVDRYNWVDIGSSFLPSDLIASVLYSQLKSFDRIQEARKKIWWEYYGRLQPLETEGFLKRPVIPEFSTVNGNFFFILAHSLDERDRLQNHLKKRGIQTTFHYFPLHTSPYYRDKYKGPDLPNARRFSDCILRLPFYYGLRQNQIESVVKAIRSFYK